MKKCKLCYKEAKLNRKGHCPDCAFKRAALAVKQMREKKGYFYEKWKKATERRAEGGSK